MLIISCIYIILSNALQNSSKISLLYSRITTYIFIYSSILILITYNYINISVLNGLIHFNYILQIFSILIFIISAIILNLTSYYPFIIINKKENIKFNLLISIENIKKIIFNKVKLLNKITMKKDLNIIEYSIIILFVVIGATFLISSLDMISIYLSIELQSYGLYILCSINKDSESSTSAGLTYFLLGALASSFILLGQSFLYANTGNTNLENFNIIITLSDISIFNNINNIFLYIQISLIIISIGFIFKISAAPFHFWSPDVYDAIPTIVTTFVATISKISILILLLEIINYTYEDFSSFNWRNNLLMSSVLSLIVGSILGLTQSRLKRLYAYSTISHLGFILLALNIYTIESIQAFFFYLIQYILSSINIFIITIIIGYSLILLSNNPNSYKIYYYPIGRINQLKGYFNINPILSLSFCISLFSFIGIPPLLGFFAKQMVINAALNQGYIFISFITILVSMISTVYYLLIIKILFFEEKNIEKHKYKYIIITIYLTDIVSILTLLILIFILFIRFSSIYIYILSILVY